MSRLLLALGLSARAGEVFALKQRVDPTNKFRSEFLDRYYHPTMPLRESDRQR
ncbi:MAG TPA: hypothetical protein VH458_11945 [Vicinamibacterales bacterium]